MKALVDERVILSEKHVAMDASSLDLSLTSRGFEMRQGSIKPIGGDYRKLLGDRSLAIELKPGPQGEFVLSARTTYVFQVCEKLFPARLEGVSLHGQATAKSSVGRMDVLARLIVDGMDEYESFTPRLAKEGTGEMFLEITPMTFDVRIKEGISLSQLRLFFGRPSEVEIRSGQLYRTVLRGTSGTDGSLTVDLDDDEIGGEPASAFWAQRQTDRAPLPLWKSSGNRPDPRKYWNTERATERADGRKSILIRNDRFYILRSKEMISVPPGIAVYCRATDESIGEMRIHYAGFVHPWFGWLRDDAEGTPLIFEVRGHDVNVSLADGEKLAKLIFYRMSQDAAEPDSEISYGKQTLQLSKFFGEWGDD